MYSRFLFLVLLLSIVYSANSAFAPFINKCEWENSKCLKESTQNVIPLFTDGIPELGVQKLDPFYMKSLDASTPGLKLKLWDLTGTGLKNCVAKKVERDLGKSKIYVKLQCSVLDFVGKYEMKGLLLILPIEGKGDAHVVLRKIVIDAEVNIGENVGEDGERHWTIKNYKHSYDVKDKCTIELENLFNGNEVLGRAAREVIATSSNEIVKEVGPPIVNAVVAKIIKNIDNFFKHVPASELSLD